MFSRISKFLFLIIATVLMIQIVIILFEQGIYKHETDRFFDAEDYSIDTVAEEIILNTSQDYRAFFIETSNTGERSGIEDKYKDMDRDRMVFNSGFISGIGTLSATRAKNCILKLNINATSENGDVKLLIIKDETILEYLSPSETIYREYDVTGEHHFYVKILCNKAQINTTVLREIIYKEEK